MDHRNPSISLWNTIWFEKKRLTLVGRVSRGGQRCYCWELRGSRSFTVRWLILMSQRSGTRRPWLLSRITWIERSIISVRAEICACRGSRLAFILSSTNSGENLMSFSPLPSIIPDSASPVLSSPCVDILGCVLESYEFPLLNVSNLLEQLIQSARGKLEPLADLFVEIVWFSRDCKRNVSFDVKRCIKM